MFLPQHFLTANGTTAHAAGLIQLVQITRHDALLRPKQTIHANELPSLGEHSVEIAKAIKVLEKLKAAK